MKIRIEKGEPFDTYPWLTEYAQHLNRISTRRWFARPFYDLATGGLVWTDETRWRRTPTEVIWALRSLWAYRTSLMLNQPREELAEYWRFGLAHFPKWVGFHSKRRVATPRLLRIYRDGEAQTQKVIEDLKRLVNE